MPADAVPTVDQDNADVRVIDQGVGERHPHGTRADDHVIGFQHRPRHGPMLTARRTLVNRTIIAEVDLPDSRWIAQPRPASGSRCACGRRPVLAQRQTSCMGRPHGVPAGGR